MDLRAVFFDLDDTLVAFDDVTESSWRAVLREYCAGRPGLEAEALFARIRESSSRYWSDPERHRIGRQDMVAARKGFLREAFSAFGLSARDAEDVAVRYSRIRLDAMYLYPGAHETLAAFRARRCALALITNGDSETQRYKIRRFDLESRFDAILVEGELGYGKPDQRVYAAALSAVGVPPEHAIMVGDNPEWDVKAAQLHGIRAAWIDRKGTGKPRDGGIVPDWTIGSVAELPALGI